MGREKKKKERQRRDPQKHFWYILWYDEKIDKAKQSSEDQGEDHCAGEVLIRHLVVLHNGKTQKERVTKQ